MKKTLKQQNEHLSELLEESQKSDTNGNIIIVGFATIIVGLAIFATFKSIKVSELEEDLSWEKIRVANYERRENEANAHRYSADLCESLAEVSGKPFKQWKGSSACYTSSPRIVLDTDEEILDAIRHYKLGAKK